MFGAETLFNVLVCFQHGDMSDAAKDIEELQTGADALELRVDLLDAKSHEEIRVQVSARVCVENFHSCEQSHAVWLEISANAMRMVRLIYSALFPAASRRYSLRENARSCDIAGLHECMRIQISFSIAPNGGHLGRL